jgi:hypothetical protein
MWNFQRNIPDTSTDLDLFPDPSPAGHFYTVYGYTLRIPRWNVQNYNATGRAVWNF